jgi:hypothetical protein
VAGLTDGNRINSSETIDNKVLITMKPKHIGCKEEGCAGKYYAYGYCSKHYQTYRLHLKSSGKWDSIKRGFREVCSVTGCVMRHLAGGLCRKHYSAEIRQKNRQFILDRYFLNGVVCKRCSKQFELVQMDAHHPNPDKKEHILSVLLNNSALQERIKLIAELDECDMLCTRCHQNGHHNPVTTHEETYQRKDKGRRVDKMKKIIREMFGDRCVDCGDVLLPKEMEFHHRNSEEKVDNVSDLMRIASPSKIGCGSLMNG